MSTNCFINSINLYELNKKEIFLVSGGWAVNVEKETGMITRAMYAATHQFSGSLDTLSYAMYGSSSKLAEALVEVAEHADNAAYRIGLGVTMAGVSISMAITILTGGLIFHACWPRTYIIKNISIK